MKTGYVAYIDESGDDGLRSIRPATANGSSEWMVLSGVLVKADKDHSVPNWVRNIRADLRQVQRPDIHFRHLRHDNKRRACEQFAQLPIRGFTVLSNKKNMQGYTNPRAASIPARNWFYCWLTRLLLERITHYCAQRTLRDWNENRLVRLIFSTRGGMSYPQLRAYMTWLKKHKFAGTQHLKQGDLDWSVLDVGEVYAFDHTNRAGLQLADILASAFFQAVEYWPNRTCDPSLAKALSPRMARDHNGDILGYGLKPMPALRKARLLPEQREIFEYYGYPREKW